MIESESLAKLIVSFPVILVALVVLSCAAPEPIATWSLNSAITLLLLALAATLLAIWI